jgi:hypothetical protein
MDYWFGEGKYGGCSRRQWPRNRSRISIWEEIFIKYHVSRNKNATSTSIQAFVTLVLLTVAEKDAKARSKRQLAIVIGSQIGPTRTAESSKKRVVWLFSTKTSKGSRIAQVLCRHAIN